MKSLKATLIAGALFLAFAAPLLSQDQPLYTRIATWNIARVHWADFEKDLKKNEQPVMEKLLADGLINQYGLDATTVHTADGQTHSTWFSSRSLANLAFLRVIPVQKMVKDPFVAATVTKALFGAQGDLLIRCLMLVPVLGTLNAFLMGPSRILLGLGRDGLFLKQAARVNAGGTPTVALALSSAASCLFLLTGTFESILAVLTFFVVVNYSISYAALVVLRVREPETPRPYRAWGYPWTTALGFVMAIVFLVGVVLNDTVHSLIALGTLTLSSTAFFIWKRLAPEAAPGQPTG